LGQFGEKAGILCYRNHETLATLKDDERAVGGEYRDTA
jgi:hypothetical protein